METQDHISVPRPRPILALPHHVIDQIAAGEVVERPSSVVKELVENSLDSGASQIEVHLIDGGLEEIIVLDNGCGISPQDLPLAVSRHATSKIQAVEDLLEISSFGFRGEALSSIGSVAELEIRSRPIHLAHGHQLNVQFGDQQGPFPVGSPVGTRIRVQKLFAQLPARKKFLRSSSTELAHISRCFKEIALGHPEVRFALSHQGRLLQKYIAPTRADRLQEVWKSKQELLHITEEAEGIRLEAFCSPPYALEERAEIWLYINGRCIQHRALNAVIRNVYSDAHSGHPSPRVALFLDMETSWVDVNVHPQKTEVRLWKQERILSWVRATLRKSLAGVGNSFAPGARKPMDSAPGSSSPSSFADGLSPSLVRFHSQSGYLVCEDETGLFLVDPHRLAERRLMEIWLQSTPLPSQVYCPPLAIRLPSNWSVPEDALSTLGWELQELGGNDWAVHRGPRDVRIERALPALLAIGNTYSRKGNLKDALVAMVGAATPDRHTPIDLSAAREWMRNFSTDQSLTCPHGHPILFRIPVPKPDVSCP